MKLLHQNVISLELLICFFIFSVMLIDKHYYYNHHCEMTVIRTVLGQSFSLKQSFPMFPVHFHVWLDGQRFCLPLRAFCKYEIYLVTCKTYFLSFYLSSYLLYCCLGDSVLIWYVMVARCKNVSRYALTNALALFICYSFSSYICAASPPHTHTHTCRGRAHYLYFKI